MAQQRTYRRPESVLVLVYTRRGEVLLLERRRPFAFWQSVTGCLEPGEAHAETAARELAEETGLTDQGRLEYGGRQRVFEIDPRWRHRYAPGATHNTEYEWRYCVPAPVPVVIDAAEHAGHRWLPIDAAIATVWSWTNREALEVLQEEL